MYADLPPPVPVLFTWSLNLMGPGDLVGTFAISTPPWYPLPAFSDFSARIVGSKFFSKLGLQKGYFQILKRPVDIPKTAIITPLASLSSSASLLAQEVCPDLP